MKTNPKAIISVGKIFAKIALITGTASANSVCRIGYYQNKVPEKMLKTKR